MGLKYRIEFHSIRRILNKGMKHFVLCLLLAVVLAQTKFNNDCETDSIIPKLATGLINLNPLDTYNNGAKKDYYQDLSLAQFSLNDVLGSAFALSGFETSCTSPYYSLVVEEIIFQDQNSRMRIVVDFRNPGDGTVTTWTMVSFTYLVVSRNLNGAYSDIWATVTEVTTPIHDNGEVAIDTVGINYRGDAATAECKVFVDPNVLFDTTSCNAADPVTADGIAGGSIVIHPYIMGFRYDPKMSNTRHLAAGVQSELPANPDDELTQPFVDTAGPNYGPNAVFYNPDTAMTYIKIAFVISRFDSGRVNAANDPYPAGSNMIYSSSYVFAKVETFNSAVALVKGAAAGTYNQNYYHLPDARYAIYGLVQFNIPKGATNPCSTILLNATLNSIDTYTVTSPNTNLVDVYFKAQIFTKNVGQLCQPGNNALLANPVFTVVHKTQTLVPDRHDQQYFQEDPAPAVPLPPHGITNPFVYMVWAAAVNGNTEQITMTMNMPFNGLTPSSPMKFEFGYFDNQPMLTPSGSSDGMVAGAEYDIKLEVNGFVLYHHVFTATGPNAQGDGFGQDVSDNILKGLNLGATDNIADAKVIFSFKRDATRDQHFYFYLKAYQYAAAYDPSTGCCVTSCPPLTGLNVAIDPPSCIYCNTNSGLIYNADAGTCTCKLGYYLEATKTFQCFPCSALYCDECLPSDPSKCTTCVTGAVHNPTSLQCTCGNGYFVNGTTCQQCPYPCANCTGPTGSCLACSDPVNRDPAQNCACINGFFDDGKAACAACSTTCQTCNSSTGCTTCDVNLHRNLTGSVCSCMTGYYEFYHTDQTRTCELCSAECFTCATSPNLCTSCDPKKDRVAGVDEKGRQTCLCMPGFYSAFDGSCIQSNCDADPNCAECEHASKICIKCLSSRKRVLKLPESVCLCQDGYYADANNTCVPCKPGCGVCSSATNCTSCVVLAIPATDGSCNCPEKSYFSVSPNGVRYCDSCGPNCLKCSDSITCLTCMNSYTKTGDNKCVCADRHYVNADGTCLPCASGCEKCKGSASTCTSCIAPLLLQGANCQGTCNNGFTAIGTVCQGCPSGCLKCTQNLICYYCADGFYMFKGKCYDVCPAGTIGDSSSGNWVCAPCNSPCKTCMNHPSFCTSCLNGLGYLQTSAIHQSCVLSCVDGTYPVGGVCQVCDFRCATCLGSATNCISCPANQILYNGGCWAQCPAISMQLVGQSASCSDACPDGYYKVSMTECAPCAIECTKC